MENYEEWPLLLKNFLFYKTLKKKNINFYCLIKKQNGIIHIDKPWGYNSYEILFWLKKKCNFIQAIILGFMKSRITGCLLIFWGKISCFEKIEHKQTANYVFVYRKIPNLKEFNKKKFLRKKDKTYCPAFFLFSLQKKQIDIEKISFFWASDNTSDLGIIEISLKYRSIINSLIINLTFIMKNKIKFLEIRKIRCGNLLEEDGQVSFHDILDALWMKNCLMKNSYFRKMIIPKEIFWSNYRRVLIKNSHINSICYGKTLQKNGILKIEVFIEKGENILILNHFGEPIAIGKMKFNLDTFLRKGIESVIFIKTVLMKKDSHRKKFNKGHKIIKKNLSLILGLTEFFKKKKFVTIKWWNRGMFL
jgi:H/ACA ribonucleoprotein complex subunit 4